MQKLDAIRSLIMEQIFISKNSLISMPDKKLKTENLKTSVKIDHLREDINNKNCTIKTLPHSQSYFQKVLQRSKHWFSRKQDKIMIDNPQAYSILNKDNLSLTRFESLFCNTCNYNTENVIEAHKIIELLDHLQTNWTTQIL